ncbi:MAG TPA: Lrp/AsnC family transcriptional regulator [Symbiobacteriaceae bacterium]|jgi:DNA-binding Lrp family transcriptional regulator
MDAQKKVEILRLLEQDGRLSPAQIAPMVGETADAVAAAIRDLQDQRILMQYTALVDWDRLLDDRVSAVIDVKITPQRDTGFDRLAERIARFPEVRSCYLMSGTYDLSVEVQGASLKEISRFVSDKLSAMDGVYSTTTHFVMKRYKHDGVAFGDGDADERLAVTP